MPDESAPLPASLRALLARAVDYAGLFPPAALDMRAAVESYAAYLEGADAWALGRFVVPAARLGELDRAAAGLLPPTGAVPWRLAAILAAEPAADAERVAHFNTGHANGAAGAMVADVVELRVDTPAAARDAATLLPPGVTAYAELALDDRLPALVAAVSDAGLRAKIRTGGVTAGAFPTARQVARFIVECTRAGVPFKATAGLHHPLRAEYALTYAPDSARAPMFGYLNVFVAAALAAGGAAAPEVEGALEATSLAELRFTDDGVAWRDREVATPEIRRMREAGAVAFGSCSFTEPMRELAALHHR